MWSCEKGVILDMCELLGKDFRTFLARVNKRCEKGLIFSTAGNGPHFYPATFVSFLFQRGPVHVLVLVIRLN